MNTTTASALIRAKVDANIFKYIDERLKQAKSVDDDYERLWREIHTLMGAGGKRIRSRIVLLTYQMLGGEDVESIIPIAAAHELLHLGMLIHDDIIDRDYVRYGVKNIAGTYGDIYATTVKNPEHRLHYAQASAILAGDLMLSDAYQLILSANIEPAKIVEVQKIFGNGIFEVIGGELLDTEAVFRGEGAASSEKIALHKTASYTFSLPMLVGACLAGASVAQRMQVTTFAQNLGIAFQLRDDVLGIFGNEDETGKTNTGDIREGKRTYMIEQFYELASDDHKQEFDQFFGKNDISNEQARRVRQLLIASHALEATEQAITRYTQKARATISAMGVEPAYLGELNELIILATERAK